MNPAFFGPVSSVVCLGAHPDDIEIGAGGTLMRLADTYPQARFDFLVLTGTAERTAEAEASARALVPGRTSVRVGGFRDGFIPYANPVAAKEWLTTNVPTPPDLVLAPHIDDRHQDHRFTGQVAWQLFRTAIILEYEIPKWEGDRPACNLLVPLDDNTLKAKIAHLTSHFRSQVEKPWYDPALFEASARLRGMETGGTYAEGFTARKLIWADAPLTSDHPPDDSKGVPPMTARRGDGALFTDAPEPDGVSG